MPINSTSIAANSASAREYGYRRAELAGKPIQSLWPKAPHAAGRAASKQAKRAFWLAHLESQGRILELLSRGTPLKTVLRALVLTIEELSGDMLGSVLLLAEDGEHAKHGAAPSLPRAYWTALDGLKIGPAVGSCGTAMYSRRRVIVSDIATDPRWARYRKLALRHGLRACWSTPIFSPLGEVLGAFALYYRQPRRPGEQEKQLVKVATELAALAIHARRRQVPPSHPAAAGPLEDLSRRELQIFLLIAQAESVKRIASRLGVTISTVYTYRARIFEKLGINSNVALTRYALTHGVGIVSLDRLPGPASQILR